MFNCYIYVYTYDFRYTPNSHVLPFSGELRHGSKNIARAAFYYDVISSKRYTGGPTTVDSAFANPSFIAPALAYNS